MASHPFHDALDDSSGLLIAQPAAELVAFATGWSLLLDGVELLHHLDELASAHRVVRLGLDEVLRRSRELTRGCSPKPTHPRAQVSARPCSARRRRPREARPERRAFGALRDSLAALVVPVTDGRALGS